MNIILQNYTKLIEEVFKNCLNNNLEYYFNNKTDYNVSSYIGLLSTFDIALCNCFKTAFIQLLEEIDRTYCNTIERKRKYHIKQKRSRTILTMFGEITYYRYYYKSKIDGSCFCYVDRILGLEKYDYFDPYIKAEILNYVSNHNYCETAKYINNLIGNRIYIKDKEKYLHRQTIRNIVMNSKVSKPKYEPIINVEELYIMADEKWIPTQNNNGKKIMQKSVVIFDNFNVNGKRKSLNNKMTFSGTGESFIYDAIDYIENSYSSSEIKKIYLLGDGASWIDGLKYYFNYNKNIQIIQALDHFHFKQCLWRIKSEQGVYNTLLDYVKQDNKEDFNRLINEIIDLTPDRKEKIEEYKDYIINHWSVILNLFKYNLSCPMESQISHTFAAYFTSRPKGYSTKTIPKLVNLRLLNKNKYNIKELYLNNIHSNEIIDLNKQTLNFSIFDNEPLYNTTHNKLNMRLAI